MSLVQREDRTVDSNIMPARDPSDSGGRTDSNSKARSAEDWNDTLLSSRGHSETIHLIMKTMPEEDCDLMITVVKR